MTEQPLCTGARFHKGRWLLCFCPHPTSVLFPLTCRAPGALAPSLQLHLGWWWGHSLHVCKTWLSSHTAAFPPQRRRRGTGAGMAPFLTEHPSTAREMRHRPGARTAQPPESEQVTSLPSPLRPTSRTHRVLHSQDSPSCAEPTRGDAILPSIVLIFNSEEEIQRL